jgi:hypothetical protein
LGMRKQPATLSLWVRRTFGAAALLGQFAVAPPRQAAGRPDTRVRCLRDAVLLSDTMAETRRIGRDPSLKPGSI